MITIEEAISIAVDAHKGQKDLDGLPVILHPLRVMLMGKSYEERIVGVLHDVVEDTSLSFADLAERGVPEACIEALKLLTHNKSVPYLDYVANIVKSGNKLALTVKLNELSHNLERGKAGGHERVVKKHTEAINLIKSLSSEM